MAGTASCGVLLHKQLNTALSHYAERRFLHLIPRAAETEGLFSGDDVLGTLNHTGCRRKSHFQRSL